ncbi:manganese catalase family protein [Candidatus Nitrosocosmicus sp. R]
MLYNLMLEATDRLQKCRLYEMCDNKAFRSTVSYLIVRDWFMKRLLLRLWRLWESIGENHYPFQE